MSMIDFTKRDREIVSAAFEEGVTHRYRLLYGQAFLNHLPDVGGNKRQAFFDFWNRHRDTHDQKPWARVAHGSGADFNRLLFETWVLEHTPRSLLIPEPTPDDHLYSQAQVWGHMYGMVHLRYRYSATPEEFPENKKAQEEIRGLPQSVRDYFGVNHGCLLYTSPSPRD